MPEQRFAMFVAYPGGDGIWVALMVLCAETAWSLSGLRAGRVLARAGTARGPSLVEPLPGQPPRGQRRSGTVDLGVDLGAEQQRDAREVDPEH